ncbi:MAG: hypothetical protein IBJ10_07190 [Phycisphaerales bacterium]|nr:hypothetical protein [Phycisphaerales bacterium]
MNKSDGLTVRRHKRHDVALDATIALAPEHAGAVRFKPPPGAAENTAPVSLVDVGEGGFGVVSTVFIPRQARIRLRVADPRDPSGPAMLEADGLVQRVTMTDRRPAYLIGASFVDESAIGEALHRLLGILGGEGPDA